MIQLPIYQVDAFAEELFSGNPAAIVLLGHWLTDKQMQQIAAENNLAETAFLVKNSKGYDIRWFTPAVEVDLCGHATLASAHIVFNFLEKDSDSVSFYSSRSGELIVKKKDERLELDFPVDVFNVTEPFDDLIKSVGRAPLEAYRGKTDYLLVYNTQEDIENMKPDFALMAGIGGRGVIITAPGKDVDFVSRFFAPQSGINEDPVTGSAHTTLTPYWAKRLGKKELSAKQISSRLGLLYCRDEGDRIKIAGKTQLYLTGYINIPE